MMEKIDWNNIFKIRLSNNVSESMDKHDVIKTLIVRKILRKYRNRAWIRVYCEFSLNGSGLKPDVYMEDLKNHSVICWEIQKVLNDSYIKDRQEKYEKVEIPYMKTTDLIIIPIKEAPENIKELNLWLEKYIF